MRLRAWIHSAWAHRAVIRSASLLVPFHARLEWLTEWTSELWYVRRGNSSGFFARASVECKAMRFCLGAFKDAFWVRRNCGGLDVPRAGLLDSPFRCVLFLSVLAAVSIALALRLPGGLDTILPVPYPDAANLVVISAEQRYIARSPTVPVEQYQSLSNRAEQQFSGVAFYQPVRTEVRTARGQTRQISIALASSNLFELVTEAVPASVAAAGRPEHTAALILSYQAWRKYFDADPHVERRVIEVAGQKAVVSGVIPENFWRLPGRVDAWLLEDERALAALPPSSKGFVLARLRTGLAHVARGRQWRLSVLNKNGGYDHFECQSQARLGLIADYLLIFLIALAVLPAVTSFSLGQYAANRNSPGWRIRSRRWIFLGLKGALLLPIVLCGPFDLASVVASGGIQPHAILIGFVFAFRWALTDQRKRCPVCLRLLSNPARIGTPSRIFLEWYGTELMCPQGHGLLHVREVPTSHNIQQWLYLDRSWSALFKIPEKPGLTPATNFHD